MSGSKPRMDLPASGKKLSPSVNSLKIAGIKICLFELGALKAYLM
jgi:hypothetical protein